MTDRRVGKSNRFLNLAHAQLRTLSVLFLAKWVLIRNNPLVIASYLGSEEVAISRSGVSTASLVGDRK
jgi:hypothetical protein